MINSYFLKFLADLIPKNKLLRKDHAVEFCSSYINTFPRWFSVTLNCCGLTAVLCPKCSFIVCASVLPFPGCSNDVGWLSLLEF